MTWVSKTVCETLIKAGIVPLATDVEQGAGESPEQYTTRVFDAAFITAYSSLHDKQRGSALHYRLNTTSNNMPAVIHTQLFDAIDAQTPTQYRVDRGSTKAIKQHKVLVLNWALHSGKADADAIEEEPAEEEEIVTVYYLGVDCLYGDRVWKTHTADSPESFHFHEYNWHHSHPIFRDSCRWGRIPYEKSFAESVSSRIKFVSTFGITTALQLRASVGEAMVMLPPHAAICNANYELYKAKGSLYVSVVHYYELVADPDEGDAASALRSQGYYPFPRMMNQTRKTAVKVFPCDGGEVPAEMAAMLIKGF
jgi:hypothetical protein